MKLSRKFEFARLICAGGIAGAAIAGAFLNGANVHIGPLDLNGIGAIVGATASGIFFKVMHFV